MVQGSQKASKQQQADTCLWSFITSESSDWTNDKYNICSMHSGISCVTLTWHQLKEWRGRSTSKNTFYIIKKRLSFFSLFSFFYSHRNKLTVCLFFGQSSSLFEDMDIGQDVKYTDILLIWYLILIFFNLLSEMDSIRVGTPWDEQSYN